LLRIESTTEGFSIYLNRQVVLRHGLKAPLVEFGTAEAAVKQHKGSFQLHQKHRRRWPARLYKLVDIHEDLIELDFVGLARLNVHETDGHVRLVFSHYNPEFNRFRLRLPATAGESIFGCGEQFTRLNLKGSRVPLWSAEQGVGRGKDLITILANLWDRAGGSWHTTYFAQPSFISSNRYWVHLSTTAYCIFDFRKPGTTILQTWAIPDEILIGLEHSAAAAIGTLSRIIGRQRPLPSWVRDGVWLGVQGGLSKIERKLQATLDAGVKVGAIWVQDWCGQRLTSFGNQVHWNWRRDDTLYPGLPDIIATYRQAGIRFLGYINPFLAVDGPLYRAASEKGYCIKHPDGGNYLLQSTTFPAAQLDLWNPEAFEWIKGIIKHDMIGIGMAGWMADFGEYLPVDAVLYGGKDSLLAHNEFPALWARANAEAIQESGKEGEIAFFMRSGWTGSTRHAQGFWAGDQLVNWSKDDGLPSVIPAGISLGLSGVGNWHVDIGGYTTVAWIKRSRECLMRWAELAAFTPIMRTHEGNRPDVNAQVWTDPALLAHFARMVKIWTALAPYHNALAREYLEEGLPPIRHPWMHYEDDPELLRLKNQYMYGRDLLVAPVLKPGQQLRDAWLPDDAWVHLWTSREFRGGPITIDAALGCPAVFYRATSPWAELFDQLRRLAAAR
jgi:alpha-glucosidase